ncbi:MAG: pyrroline-5-carboxylate reductase [Rhodococcus sp.]|nr:pyrroline-5-carboxylate reductase [Rhodococcus sp. (in: high G+C Gram-positive bacteria)]
MTRIAVIGGGRIGEALISGLLRSGHAVKDIVVSEHFPARAKELSDKYKILATGIGDAVEGADVIVIAVKPGDVESVTVEIDKVDGATEQEQILVSLAAGVTTAFYEKRLPAGFPVVRVMPNTPMLVGHGMSVLAPGRHANDDHLKVVRDILGAVGETATVKEDLIDAVTAVSGSGPAYIFLVAEAMVDAAVSMGLPRPTATQLVNQTISGAAAMLHDSGESATELRGGVSSPGGTTAAAIRQLESFGLRRAFYEGLDAAKTRSEELAAGLE